METGSLFDDDEATTSAELLPTFFALQPDPDTALRVDEARRRLGLKGSIVLNLHMTLFSIGPQAKLSRDEVVAAKEAGASITAARFEVEFDHVLTFANGRARRPVVMCGSSGLPAWMAFQHELGIAARKAGAIRSAPRYEPHLTLAYGGAKVDRIEIEPIRWTVRDFTLVRSHTGEGRHEELGRWSLVDAGGVR